MKLFPLGAYKFGAKEYQTEEDASVTARLTRLHDEVAKNGGMRRTVEAVLLVHDHGHPHVLTLQLGGSFYKLPGDQLVKGEKAEDGLKRILDHRLGVPGVKNGWRVHELLATWWRPNYENVMYPYLPTHIEHPKEQKQLFLVELPQQMTFAVPKNYKLLAVPLFELYDNVARYGAQIASLPFLLSRVSFDAMADHELEEKNADSVCVE